VSTWIAERVELFLGFAKNHRSTLTTLRRLLAQSNQLLEGSTAECKLDVDSVADSKASEDFKCHWSQILVPGELKSNSDADAVSKTWLDLRRYVREVRTYRSGYSSLYHRIYPL
jgi:Fungal protein kinase